jgi:hypothetical protein
VRAKTTLKIKRSAKTMNSEIKNLDIGKINKKEVKEEIIKAVTPNVQNTQLKEVEDMTEI